MSICKYKIYTVVEYNEWFEKQTAKEQFQIEARIGKIMLEGHFGDHKSVSPDDTVWELRWKNGRRVYYSYIPEKNILLLLGGNKNGQKKDITKAKNILRKNKKSED